MNYFSFLGHDPEQVLAKVNPILDDMLAAHEQERYDLFANHLQEERREKLSEKQFLEAARRTSKRLGTFQNRRFLGALRRDDRPMLLWSAKFSSSENDILISLVLEQQGDEVVVNWFWME